jgi:uncharacterized protein (DUF58 family)
MRPTRFGLNGVAFTGAMYAAFYGSPYSNLFFLLLGFLTLTMLSGLLAARRNLSGVTAELLPPPPAPSGTPIGVAAHLTAPCRMRFDVRVRLVLASGEEIVGRADCLAGSQTATLLSPSLPRGRHAVRRATLESLHPFGLVRVVRSIAAPRELLVYPRPREHTSVRSVVDARRELLGQATLDVGDLQPSSLRDHTAADGTRGIHWRASAKRDKLVVREWEGGGGEGVEVLLDRRAGADELEDALTTLSTLVHVARAGKETVRLHTQGLSATYGSGHRPWDEVLGFLAGAEALPPSGPPPPVVSPGVPRLPARKARAVGAHHGE